MITGKHGKRERERCWEYPVAVCGGRGDKLGTYGAIIALGKVHREFADIRFKGILN